MNFFSEKYSALLDMMLSRENKSFTRNPVFPEYLIYYEYTQARFKEKFVSESKIFWTSIKYLTDICLYKNIM